MKNEAKHTEPCEACDGVGILAIHYDNEDARRMTIERCDSCGAYESDKAAADAVLARVAIFPDLLAACEAVVNMPENINRVDTRITAARAAIIEAKGCGAVAKAKGGAV